MSVLEIIILLAIVALTLSDIYDLVPDTSFAVPLFCGGRMKTVWREGLKFPKLPFLVRVDDDLVFSLKMQHTEISFTFPTKDNVDLRWGGRAQFYYDPSIRDSNGHIKCATVSDKEVRDGLTSDIRDLVKDLGGKLPYTVFRSKSGALTKYINCILRLPAPPHVNPDKYIGPVIRGEATFDGENIHSNDYSLERLKKEFLEKARKLKEEEDLDRVPSSSFFAKEIPAAYRVLFHEVFSGPIGDLLRAEEEFRKASEEKEAEGLNFNISDNSPLEEKYGRDIANLSNDEVGFNDEMLNALEARRRRKEELKGMQELQAKKLEWINELRDQNIDPNTALDSTDALLEIADKQSISLSGLEGLISLSGSEEVLQAIIESESSEGDI